MNKETFEDLFEKQKKLDEFILSNNEKVERKTFEENLILALLVEVGELANETRVFKHWSKKGANDKEPIYCNVCDGTGDSNYHMMAEPAESNIKHRYTICDNCEGTGIVGYKNPILEEFADCMHFLLSIGNLNERYKQEIYKEKVFYWDVPKTLKSTQQLFIDLYKAIVDFEIYKSDLMYAEVWARLLELGKRLHLTEKDMLNGYEKKNKINYERQRNGY